MAVGDDRAVLLVPGTTEAELEAAALAGRLPRARSIFFLGGINQFGGGHGSTPGGISLGAGAGGGEPGSAIGFKVIAVDGLDPSLWVSADQVDDTLTLQALRGLVISTSPANDRVTIGFPDGGAFGNVWMWTGSAWVPNPPPAPTFEPQEGDYDNDKLIETVSRKFWDGFEPLNMYLPAVTPAGTVVINGAVYPLMGDAATGLLRADGRVQAVTFSAIQLRMKVNAVATSGNIRLVARLDRVTDIAAADSFAADTAAAFAVPASGDFLCDMTIAATDSLAAGDMFRVEFGRLGADAADTAAGDLRVVDAWLKLA